ncbi:MAG: peptidase S8 [Peptococcaceae bacterium]|nr:MAG: peptidase S8 [Peptococcaceae bacterium]
MRIILELCGIAYQEKFCYIIGKGGEKVIKKGITLLLVIVLLVVTGFSTAVATPQQNGIRKIIVVDGQVLDQKSLSGLVKQNGGEYIKPLPLISGAAVVLPDLASLHVLRNTSGVIRISDDIIMQALPAADTKVRGEKTAQPAEVLPWGVDRIDAEQVWPGGVTGTNVKVAFIDTGVDKDHPDLKGNLKGGILTINTGPYARKNPAKGWEDDNGHGTHVAGIMAALDNTIGVTGVGPTASLYAVKALDRKGSGYLSDVIEGIDWCIQNGMDVVNMSLGASTDSLDLHAAVQRAYEAGIVVVAAAGNDGPGDNTVLYPARYPEAIAVAATNKSDELTAWSSRGTEVDLAAPGDGIYSTYKGDTYATMSGTSMAAPHVAGTVALYLAKYGSASPEYVREHLIQTAESLLASPYPLVDAYQAAASQ